MGDVIHVRFGNGSHEPLLTKKQLAAHPSIRKSTRWVEIKMRKGLPSTTEGNRRMFSLSAVNAWMEKQGLVPGGSPAPAPAKESREAVAAGSASAEGNEEEPLPPAAA